MAKTNRFEHDFEGHIYYFMCSRCKSVQPFRVSKLSTLVCQGCYPYKEETEYKEDKNKT